MSDTFTNFIKRDDFAALREENERLKSEVENEKGRANYNYKNFCDTEMENIQLHAAKRELVEVIEKTLQIITDTLIYYAVFNYPEQPEIVLGEVLKAAVAKHREV